MIRVIERIKVKMENDQEPEIRDELKQLMDMLNKMNLELILACDMADGIIRRLDGDE